ncbi:S8 family serine peptidase [Spirosoma luteum]|uniref:S8 family serine peptidase n=1 Tax=Spirosoma luteum TaxID=431553 RepID=UPI00036B1A24|nr:S8 family serine peptidase [Spirosoma luteum]
MKPTPNPKDPYSTPHQGSESDDKQFKKLDEIKATLGIYSPIALIPGFKKLIAVPYQKILIVRTGLSISSELLTPNNQTTLDFIPVGSSTPISLPVRVVRVCEYPNPDDEYGMPTNTVLIEWQPINTLLGESNKPFGTFVDDKSRIAAGGQIENLIVQDPPNNRPGPPIVTVEAAEDIPLPDGFFVEDSDFTIHPPQGTVGDSTNPIVAVLDTGIKTQFNHDDGTTTNQYPDSSQPSRMKSFKLAQVGAESTNVLNKNGYSPVTNYLRASQDSDPVADRAYRNISTLTRLSVLSNEKILNSPYDDHLITNGEEVRGRHGTTISAIINQKSTAAVLPVKIFNHGGQGTLYDLLCGLNYVLACHGDNFKVRVVNLSLAGQFHYDAYKLLYAKFRALHKAGIWTVAAAGNRKITDDETSRRELKMNVTAPPPRFDPSANTSTREVWNLFPACFAGDPELSVITVTTVRKSPDKDVALQPKSPTSIWVLIGTLLGIVFSLFKSPKKFTVTPVYKTVNNYGKSFVSVGVVEPLTKVFKNANSGLNTTSFAAAFFSAKLADYLKDNATANRQRILDDLTFRGEMFSNNEIADNRLICYE